MDQIIERARWRVGPLRLFANIQFRDIGYDNNIYRVQDWRDPVGDITFTISPTVTANLITRGRLIISFMVNPEYIYFVNEVNERSLNYNYSPSIRFLLFQRFSIGGSYFHQKSRRRASSEFYHRAWELRDDFRVNAFYESARRVSFGFTAFYRELKYEDRIPPDEIDYYARNLNRLEANGQLELYYLIFSDSFLFFYLGRSEYEFESPDSRWRDSYSYHFYSGLQFPIFGRIRGVLSLGYKVFEPYRSRKKGYAGFVGNTTLNYRLRRFIFRAGYSRDIPFSISEENIFFIEDRYSAGVSFYLTQFIRLDVDLSYSDAFYPEPITIRLPDESYADYYREDEYISYSLGLVFRIFRNTGIGITGTYWERESNFPGANRSQWFLGGYLTYDF